MEPENYWILEENRLPKVYFQVPCGPLRCLRLVCKVSELDCLQKDEETPTPPDRSPCMETGTMPLTRKDDQVVNSTSMILSRSVGTCSNLTQLQASDVFHQWTGLWLSERVIHP